MRPPKRGELWVDPESWLSQRKARWGLGFGVDEFMSQSRRNFEFERMKRS